MWCRYGGLRRVFIELLTASLSPGALYPALELLFALLSDPALSPSLSRANRPQSPLPHTFLSCLSTSLWPLAPKLRSLMLTQYLCVLSNSAPAYRSVFRRSSSMANIMGNHPTRTASGCVGDRLKREGYAGLSGHDDDTWNFILIIHSR